VTAGVGKRQVGLAGELLDGPLAVGEDVQQLDPPATAQRLAHLGERVEQGRLGRTVRHVALLAGYSIKLLTN
jgi:hypothetical protein